MSAHQLALELNQDPALPRLKKTVAIFSGGMDSTVLLYHLLAQGAEVKALSIDYGQRHRRELEAAKMIAEKLGIEHATADLRGITHLISNSSQTSMTVDVPEGHYAEESMKLTVVPNRNMIMLSVAIGWAINNKFDSVAYGAHGGDHAIYPDCRENFARAVDYAARHADWNPVSLLRPFIGISKADIAALGAELGVPFHLTWSCYKGGIAHCGKCGTCVERKEAFELAGVRDPTMYQGDVRRLINPAVFRIDPKS